jgi:hypothetical protein
MLFRLCNQVEICPRGTCERVGGDRGNASSTFSLLNPECFEWSFFGNATIP